MYIRRAEERDLAAVLKIYAAARRYMRQNGNASQWGDSYPKEALLRQDLEREQLCLCVEKAPKAEEKIPGTEAVNAEQILAVFVLLLGDDPNYQKIEDGAWPNDEPYATVHRIAVSDEARGRGAARFCLDWAAEQADNLRIDTHADNLPMQRLIAKCGFVRAGIVHMEDGSPRIAYAKRTGRQKGKQA